MHRLTPWTDITHKHIRQEEEHKMDYINELPDCVFSYLLSMLTIKDSLRTSVVSKRWFQVVFNQRRVLNFDAHNILGNDNEMIQAGYLKLKRKPNIRRSGENYLESNFRRKEKELIMDGYIIFESKRCSKTVKYLNLSLCGAEFVKRVDKYLKNFKGTKIDTFKVNFNYLKNHKHRNSVYQWISFAFSKGAERIDILFFDGDPYEFRKDYYKFPFTLVFGVAASSSSTVVKHMHLQRFLMCDTTTTINNFVDNLTPFKNLRSFKLEHGIVDDIFITSLLSNCHLLECLSLICCNSKSPMLNIASSSSSSLCHLEIRFCHLLSNRGGISNDLKVSLDCFKLTSLDYDGCCKNLSYINTPELKSITYNFGFDELSDAFAIFATLPRLEILRINLCYYKYQGDISVRIAQQLKHVKELNLVIDFSLFEVDISKQQEFDHLWILNILQAFPLLQKLGVMVANPQLFDIQKDIEVLPTFSHNEINVIEMRGCVGNQFEIEFAMNALKYAHKLEQIVMSPYWGKVAANPDWTYNQGWFQSGREMVREKLQNEVSKGKAKLILI